MIILASIHSPTYQGGLAAYMRELSKSLANSSYKGFFYSFQGDHPVLPPSLETLSWKTVVAHPPAAPIFYKIMMSLAGRSYLQGFLPTMAAWTFSASDRLIVTNDTKVVHFVGTGWHFQGFSLAREARKKGARFTIWPAVHPNSWGDHAIDLRLYQMADTVFCQSTHEKKHLAQLGVAEDKMVLCGLPPMCRTDGNGDRLRHKLNLGNRPVVLFVGRRDAGKGYSALLNAWPLVIKQISDAVLLVAGPPDKEPLSLNPEIPSDNIRDLGVPDEVEKADALAACDLFCLPSAHESFGIVYVEAWSYAKPVVCGTAPASRELVEDGVTGWWGNQDSDALAQILIHALKSPEILKKMGDHGLTVQKEKYSMERTRDIHLKAFFPTLN